MLPPLTVTLPSFPPATQTPVHQQFCKLLGLLLKH